MSKANTAPPAAAGTITIDATGSETMNFASFVRGGFLEGIAGSGFPNFDNSSGSVGKEMMFSYGTGASDKYVLMQGNIEYSFATQTVAGTGNTIDDGNRVSGDDN